MNLLLDTHALLWWMDDSKRLGPRSRALLKNPQNDVWISAISIWEISIKSGTGRLKLAAPFEERIAAALDQGILSLSLTFKHAFAVRNLPLHHNDPFDRMLIAQAQCESLTLMTSDAWFRAYDVRSIDASA